MKKSAKKLVLRAGLFLALALFVLPAAQFAFAAKTTNGVCAIPALDPDKIPFPIKDANTHYELAENENYVLNGFVITMNGQVAFRLDLESQPWLATERRTHYPYFVIDPDHVALVRKFEGQRVQLAVTARHSEVATQGDFWATGVMLSPLIPPIPFESR